MATKRKKNVVDTTAELRAQMKRNGVALPHGYQVVKRKTKKTVNKKSNKGTIALKKINAEAKRIQKSNPGISWANALKQASKKYKAK